MKHYLLNNVLVTGGCGFIGSHLIDSLLVSNDIIKVINLDKLTYSAVAEYMNSSWAKNPRYEFILGDINDQELVIKIIHKYQIDTVIHLASESHVDNSIANPGVFIKTNINGTFNLLEALRRYCMESNRKNDIRFHHVSTDEVYGSICKDREPVDETEPYNPSSPYSASKASSDHLVQSYFTTFGIQTTMSHCTNNFGSRQHVEKLIPKTIMAFKNNNKISIYGNGQQQRDWLYVKAHCEGILKILSLGMIGEKYNISANCELTNLKIIEKIHQIMSHKSYGLNLPAFEECIQFVHDRPGHDIRYSLNHEKLSSNCGWKNTYTLDESLKLTIDDYLSRPTL